MEKTKEKFANGSSLAGEKNDMVSSCKINSLIDDNENADVNCGENQATDSPLPYDENELGSEGGDKKNEKKKEKIIARSKKIALMAVFLGIGIIFNVMTFPSMSFFGRMTLIYFYCFLTGIVVGPCGGAIVTVLADIIVFFFGLVPGAFVPQLTVSNGIMAVLMGLTYKKLGRKHFKLYVVLIGIFCWIFLSAGLNAWGEAMFLFDMLPYTFAKLIGKTLGLSSPFLMLSISKLITQSFWIAANCYLLILITPVVTGIMDKNNFK